MVYSMVRFVILGNRHIIWAVNLAITVIIVHWVIQSVECVRYPNSMKFKMQLLVNHSFLNVLL